MLEALATLLAFQLLGEAIAHLSGWPVPGPVIGMALLFAAWPVLRRLQQRLAGVADVLLANFGLLFVPAGVGVMLHAGLLADWWAPLLLGVVASTAATMALTALLFGWLRRRQGPGGPPAAADGVAGPRPPAPER
jgi:holin-like protein